MSWETEIEMTEVLDVFRVSLTLSYDGNDEFEVEGGENTIGHVLVSTHMVEEFRFCNRTRQIGR